MTRAEGGEKRKDNVQWWRGKRGGETELRQETISTRSRSPSPGRGSTRFVLLPPPIQAIPSSSMASRKLEDITGVLQHFFIYKWQGQNHHKMTNKPIYVLLKWHFLGTILIFQVFCPHISPDPILIHQLGLKSILNRVSIKTIYTSIIIIKYLNPTELTIASILIIVVSPVSSPNLQKAQCHSQ